MFIIISLHLALAINIFFILKQDLKEQYVNDILFAPLIIIAIAIQYYNFDIALLTTLSKITLFLGSIFLLKVVTENILFTLANKNFEFGEADILFIAIISFSYNYYTYFISIYLIFLLYILNILYLYLKTKQMPNETLPLTPHIAISFVIISIYNFFQFNS